MSPRSFTEFARTLVGHLNKTGVDYAITGALAASYYGTPRTTIDADFIVHLTPGRLEEFLNGLETIGLRVNRERVKKQLKAGYNVISVPDRFSPHTADFILTRNVEKRKGTLSRHIAYYQTPEALVLAKLRMIKTTLPRRRSYKDEDDIKAILTNTSIDMGNITRKAKRETTEEIFRDITRLLK